MLVLYIIRNGNYLILGAPYWIYSIPLYFTYPSKKNILLKWLSEKKMTPLLTCSQFFFKGPDDGGLIVRYCCNCCI